MNRLAVFLVVVGALALSFWASGGDVGARTTCVSADCVVAVSSSPLSIAIAIGLVLFLVFLPRRAYVSEPARLVGVWRRFGAFFVDLALVLVIASPLAALPALIAETSYSGRFAWSFERDFWRPTDAASFAVGVIAEFVALFFYFYAHLRVRRPTIGQYVLGYRVVPVGGDRAPMYGMRVVLSFLGLCAWPVSVFLALFSVDGSFWWDAVTATKAVRVAAAAANGDSRA